MAVTPDTIPPIGSAPDWPVLAGVTDKNAYLAQVEVADTRQQPYTDEQNTAIDAINTVAGQTQSNAEIAETKAGEAESSASSALDSRNEAEVFKDSAEAAAIAAGEGAGLPSGGSDGDVLTLVDSVAGTVAFTPPPKGGLAPILTVQALGDSAIDFTNLDSYGYDSFEIAMNITSSDTIDRQVYLQTSTDNGASFTPSGVSNYYSTEVRSEYTPSSSATNLRQLSSNVGISVSTVISTSETNCSVSIGSALNASSYTNITYRRGYYSQLGEMQNVSGYGVRPSNEANNAIRLITSGGTITGTITLYGVSKA